MQNQVSRAARTVTALALAASAALATASCGDGFAEEQAPIRLAALAISPGALDLGQVEAGHVAQSTIELRNMGDRSVPLDSIAIDAAGAAAGFVRGISTCGAKLGPGESCDVAIRLVPQALGPLAGGLAVVSGSQHAVVPLAAAAARRVSIALAGGGAGTVTSTPAGLSCGATCEALFDTDAITLTAAPGAGAILVGWSLPACGQGPACTLPPGLEPLAVTATFAPTGAGTLALTFAGDATGEVQIEASWPETTLVTCFASCNVPIEPGVEYTLTAATPSGFGGITGACATTTGTCWFDGAAGTLGATATFTKDPKERWTRLPAGTAVRSLAYDGAGNLIVALAPSGLAKLSPAGATSWTLPLAGVRHVATGPGNTIYVLNGMLRKLDPDGAELWARPLPPEAQGGGAADFERSLAVGADGAVAVRGSNGVARWDAAGALSWATVLIDGPRSVVIDAAGVVHAAQPSAFGDSVDVVRFSPAGVALPPLEFYTGEYHAVLALDGAGQLMATSSGHSSVILETDAFWRVLSTSDGDWVPTGAAGAGTGDVLWVYQPSELGWPVCPWTARRYSAAGAERWSLARQMTSSWLWGSLGATPGQLAAGPSGELAVGGTYTGLSYTGAWVQTFAP